MDALEITQPDGPGQSSSPPVSGLPSQPLASWGQTLADSVNQLAAIGAVMWSAPSLIALASTDARPLLGAGLILLTAAVRARPRDVVSAIRAWRSK